MKATKNKVVRFYISHGPIIGKTILFAVLVAFCLSVAHAAVPRKDVEDVYAQLLTQMPAAIRPQLKITEVGEHRNVWARVYNNEIVIHSKQLLFWQNKNEVAMTLAHELGHFYFGSVVFTNNVDREKMADMYGRQLALLAGFDARSGGYTYFTRRVEVYELPDSFFTTHPADKLRALFYLTGGYY